MNKHHPFHPIIYVRGFAATMPEIEETVADPFMGFNIGRPKLVVWTTAPCNAFTSNRRWCGSFRA